MENPIPPVAARPWMPPPQAAVGNTGVEYGIQSLQVWEHGTNDERTVIDSVKCHSLWRISVFGFVKVRVVYGTAGTIQIADLLAPVVMTLPGQVSVSVTPRASSGQRLCRVTLTQATAGARAPAARKLADAGGGVVTLDENAVSYTALTASTLTMAGVVGINVPALSTVPLVAGAVLLTGSGFQEFEA